MEWQPEKAVAERHEYGGKCYTDTHEGHGGHIRFARVIEPVFQLAVDAAPEAQRPGTVISRFGAVSIVAVKQ